uniref:Uncharacterized protein n=1 Tax=Physcomitrium patens TaxID=3218 RepID=A0A7I3ZQG2_PHYPA
MNKLDLSQTRRDSGSSLVSTCDRCWILISPFTPQLRSFCAQVARWVLRDPCRGSSWDEYCHDLDEV